MSEVDAHQRFLSGVESLGLDATIVERPPANSLEESAATLGISPADIVKSLVLRHKDGTYLFALIPGDRQISWQKLRDILGVNRVSMPSAAEALQVTGYERGTITPVGSTTPWPVYADQSIQGKTIHMGAGKPGAGAIFQADELLGALDATVADISTPND